MPSSSRRPLRSTRRTWISRFRSLRAEAGRSLGLVTKWPLRLQIANLDGLKASRDGVQHVTSRLSEEILADEDGIDYLCTNIDRLLNLLTRAGSVFHSRGRHLSSSAELVK